MPMLRLTTLDRILWALPIGKKPTGPRGSNSEVADHIDHIRKVAGVDHIGIGADHYEVNPESMVLGLENVTRYPHLFAELLRCGYSDDDVLKIAG